MQEEMLNRIFTKTRHLSLFCPKRLQFTPCRSLSFRPFWLEPLHCSRGSLLSGLFTALFKWTYLGILSTFPELPYTRMSQSLLTQAHKETFRSTLKASTFSIVWEINGKGLCSYWLTWYFIHNPSKCKIQKKNCNYNVREENTYMAGFFTYYKIFVKFVFLLGQKNLISLQVL
jgi:hypothetical protein